MAKRLKRAFTITELVIVIAVVAILAAVLIPTFSNIIKKADESADTQLVKNLNTILSSEQTVSQEAAPTMSKALEQAQEGGYTVDKLTPTSDGDILWEQDSNRFVLVSGGEIIFKDSTTTASIQDEPYKFWKITNKESEVTDGEYSHYLADGFTGTAFTVKAGIDTGENTTVTSITYASPVTSEPAAGAERTVIINTNKNRCNVTVDAPFDTVRRYGDAATVSVNETASQSYHEFGDVNTLVVGEGHVYVDEGGYVGILDCTKAGNATVGKASTGTINSVLVKDDSSAGSILEDSVKTAIENGETEQVKASDVPAESSLFAGGIGTEKSPFLIETAEQFAKIAELDAQMKEGRHFYFRLQKNIYLEELTAPSSVLMTVFNGTLEGDNHIIYGSDEISYIFKYGYENAIFKDITVQFASKNITRLIYIPAAHLSSAVNSTYMTDISEITIGYYNVDYVGQEGVTYQMGSDNSALYVNENCSALDAWWNNDFIVTCNDEVKVQGTTSDYLRANLIMEDCDVTANFSGGSGNSGAAVFLGGQIGAWTYPVFQNCSYNGTFTGKNVGVLFANQSSTGKYMEHITVENLSVAGQILSLGGNSGVTFANNKTEHPNITQECKNKVLNLVADATLDVFGEENGEYTITAATNDTVDYYEVQLSMRTIYWYTNGYDQPWTAQTNSNYLTIRVEADKLADTSVFKAKAISKYEAELAENAAMGIANAECNLVSKEGYYYTFTEGADGTMYLVIDYEKSGMQRMFELIDYVKATVFAYNDSGVPVAFAQE